MPYYIGQQYTKTAQVSPPNATNVLYNWFTSSTVSAIGPTNQQSITFIVNEGGDVSVGVQVGNSCSTQMGAAIAPEPSCRYLEFDGFLTAEFTDCHNFAEAKLLDSNGMFFYDPLEENAVTIAWSVNNPSLVTFLSPLNEQAVNWNWNVLNTSAVFTVTLTDCTGRQISQSITLGCTTPPACIPIDSVTII